MKYSYSILKKRFCQLNKKIFFAWSFLFTSLLFANALDDVENDVQNFLNYGYRPISYSTDEYINSQGTFQDFGISTVAAIDGRGFFCVIKDDSQIILTRNGFFFWNDEGFLVNHDGYRVLHRNSDIEEKKYNYITSDDINGLRKKTTKRMSLAGNYVNDIDSTPYLIVYPIKNFQILSGEYMICNEVKKISAHVIYGAREFNPMQLKELYLLCLNVFDNYKELEFIEQKKRIVSKLEVIISHLLNTNPYTPEELKNELNDMIITLRGKI